MSAGLRALATLPRLHNEDVIEAWEAAQSSSVPRHYLPIRLGGCSVAIEVIGTALAERLFAALAHRRTDIGPQPAALQLKIWDSAATGVPYPRYDVRGIYDEDEFGLLRLFSDRRHVALEDRWLGMNASLDRTAGHAWIAYKADAAVPEFERTAPLRNIFQLLLSERGWHLVHAAMIGRGDRALLLAGAGGAGKSTTAFTALLAGWSHGSDDLCLFHESRPQGESIYQTVKMREGGGQRLSEALPLLRQYEECGEQKAYLFAGDQWPDRVMTDAKVVALLVPSIVDAQTTVVTPMDWQQALAATLPWTRQAIRVFGPRSQVALISFLRRMPVYSLQLGRDRDGVLSALDQTLDRHP